MKIRMDFVTNSSSSSFIVDRNDCSYGKLLKIMKELAQISNYDYGGDYKYKWKDLVYDEETGEVSIGNFCLSLITKDKPYRPYTRNQTEQEFIDEMSQYGISSKEDLKKQYQKSAELDKQYEGFNHHYLVDNHGNFRYDVYEVENIFEKNGIPIVWGYCD